MKALGIDPGSKSWDLVILEDGLISFERTVPTKDVVKDPEVILDMLNSTDLDSIVAPSGYGLPLKTVSELTEDDLSHIILKKKGFEKGKIVVGLEAVLRGFRSQENSRIAYILPGVKHLSTVPDFRKVNRIDMGTADKLCSVALAIVDQTERIGVPYGETSFILCELGSAFNSFIAVEDGRIIDGIGGTLSSSGGQSIGHFDSELAYLLPDIRKHILSMGGFDSIQDKELAMQWYLDGIKKDIAAISRSLPEPLEIIITGRRGKEVFGRLRREISELAPISFLRGRSSEASASAEGAAMIASGLEGGVFKELVEHMMLRNATGSVFDFVYLNTLNTLG